MSKHTPGPWVYELYPSGGFEIESPNGSSAGGLLVISSRSAHRDVEAMHANARVIAAAPQLLEALESVLSRYVGPVECGDCGKWDAEAEPQVIAARAAIKAAKGET